MKIRNVTENDEILKNFISQNPNFKIGGTASYIDKGGVMNVYKPTNSVNSGGNGVYKDDNGVERPDIAQELANAYSSGRYEDTPQLERDFRTKVARTGANVNADEYIMGLRQQYAKGYNDYQQNQQLMNILNKPVTSQYDKIYQDLLKKYNNYTFDNFTNSAAYQGLRDLYEQSGKKAMKDVLGEVSARTGGYASSYATAAAQEQYNEYMQRLATLAEQAFNNERGEMLSGLNQIGGRAENEISRGMQEKYNQYNALKGIYDQRKAEELAEQQAEAKAEADTKAAAIKYIEYALGNAGVPLANISPELIAQSGLPNDYLVALEQEWQNKKAQQDFENDLAWSKFELSASKKGGSGGGSRKSTGGGSQSIDQIKDNITRYMETGSTKDELISAVDDLYKSGKITGDQRTSLYDYIKILFRANTFTIPESRKVK